MFHKKVDFSGAKFDDVTFSGITFEDEALFENVNFKPTILGCVNFRNTTFKKLVNFSEAKFHEKQDTVFDNATFVGNILFNKAHFLGDKNHFVKTNFEQAVDFSHTVFKNRVNFSEAEFKELPKLTGIEARGGIDLNKTDLPENALGGLHSEDAQNTWHIFYKAMQDEQRFDKVTEYFTYYNDARLQDANVSWLRKSVLKLYKLLSSYGNSIFKPLLALGVSVLVFSVIYNLIIYQSPQIIIQILQLIICAGATIIFFCGFLLCPKYIISPQREKNIKLYFLFFSTMSFAFYLLFLHPQSLYLSTHNMFPFITDNVVLLDKIFNSENGTNNKTFLQMAGLTIENTPEEKQKYLWLLFPVRMIQFLFSTLCLFLFGLGVRNFLRLK